MISTALLLAVPCAPVQGSPAYDALILQAPAGGVAAAPLRVNSAGVCVGDFLNTTTGYFDGVVWDAAGVPTALSASHGFVEAAALGIRDEGTIVGSGSTNPFEVSHAVILDPGGGMTTLPSLAGDAGVVSAAFDMSDAGTAVGRSALFATPFWISTFNDAVMWESGVVTSLGTLGGFFAEARRVNESKRIIGRSNTATDDFARGFVWDPVAGMREITPAAPGGYGQASGLDDQGRICGQATQGPTWLACLWEDPDLPPALLPNLPGDAASHAVAIDPAGTLVGSASRTTGENRARLWRDGQVYDLNDLLAAPLPFPLTGALDISPNGRILAQGSGFEYVVLTPVVDTPALTGTPRSISVGAGGAQQLDLAGGGALAGGLYLMLGSLSGTAPGIAIGGFTLPLNPDPYFAFTLNHAGSPPLSGALGFLDAAGAGQAAFTLPAGSPPVLVGLQLHHAYGALDTATGAILGTSNAAPLDLAP